MMRQICVRFASDVNKMKKSLVKWLAKILRVPLEPPFEIVDNIDIFVRDKLNSMLEDVESFDIATGYFQISGWRKFANSVEELLKKGGKVRLLIGDVSREYLSPQTARFLLHLIKNPQIEARTIKPRLLHAKVFMAKTRDSLKLLFGSSNLTIGGTEANIELNTYEILGLDSEKAKSFIEWYNKLWELAVPIDEELEIEITLAGQKEEVIPVSIEDPNKALFLSLLIRDLARVDLRDIGNFAPLKFQYVDAVAGINRFFFQPGGKRGLMLAHEVGLGKTIISGMILKHLLHHRHIKNVLIITPLSIARQWVEDLKSKFSIEPVEITGRRIKGFSPEDSKVYITPYDLLREHIKDFPKEWDLVIVDESHFIRNSQTLRFKAVKELKPKFWLLLTATPMHNRIEDIATQLFLFVPEEIISKATKREISRVDRTRLFKTFIKRRLQKKELSDVIPERKVLPPEIISLLQREMEIYDKLLNFLSKESRYYQIISRSIEHIAPFIKQRYLEEFISSKSAAIFALNNLKERIKFAIKTGYIEYNFGMIRRENEGLIMDEIRSFIEDELEAQSDVETLRDEEGNLIIRFAIDDKIKEGLEGDINHLNSIIGKIEKLDEFSKVKRTVELIKKLKPLEDKKMIVFVGFIKTGESIVSFLEKEGIKAGFFYGELEEAQRKRLIERLWSKDEDRVDVLVSTDAAYVGLNLQIADTIIHHDLSWNPMVVEQRIGRIHRIGQKKSITSHSFLCKDTIDKRKHEILTEKLEEIATHLGMSYSVILSEVAISSEIERLMAQFELKEIDKEILKDKIRKHIADRREIFELLEDLPSEEAEILQVGFTNDLIEEMEEIVGEIIKLGRRIYNFKIKPVIEDEDFLILEYEVNGKRIKELATLNDKALLRIEPERVSEWKEKYKFDNLNPSYLGPFHPVVHKIISKVLEDNPGKFWKKKLAEGRKAVALYLLVPIIFKNPTAEIDTSMEILTPIIYEPDRKDIRIDASLAYKLTSKAGKLEEMNPEDMKVLEEAQSELRRKLPDIKAKIRSDIEKVKVEIEELASERRRLEIESRIKDKRKRLENLNSEIARKRSAGLKYDKEMREAKKIKREIEELRKMLEVVPESSLIIDFEKPKIAGGCLYVSSARHLTQHHPEPSQIERV